MPGPGANDNASGTAALLELARAYAPSARAARVHLPYSLLFLSTDGAVYGGLGAAWFAAHAPEAADVIAVINLDTIAGAAAAPTRARRRHASLADSRPRRDGARAARGRDRRPIRGARARCGSSSISASRTAATSRRRSSPAAIPAVTITTAGDRPRSGALDDAARLRAARLGQIGRAAQNAIDALQQGVALAPGPSSYIYLGSRIVRGWAVELVLVGALLPFLAATVDLFARCRRRRIRVAPALRSYRSRLGFWVWCGALFALFTLLGAWPDGAPRPPPLDSVRWPTGALVALAVLAGLGWIVARDRLLPRRDDPPRRRARRPRGARCSRSASSRCSLWQQIPLRSSSCCRRSTSGSGCRRCARARSGCARSSSSPDSPARCSSSGRSPRATGSAGTRRGTSRGSSHSGTRRVPGFVIALACAAAAGQLVALVGGRYAPYPSAAERPPRGPLRQRHPAARARAAPAAPARRGPASPRDRLSSAETDPA